MKVNDGFGELHGLLKATDRLTGKAGLQCRRANKSPTEFMVLGD